MRIDWYQQYPHPEVIAIADELYSYMPSKSQGSNKESRDKKLKAVCLQFISALYLNHNSLGAHENPVTTYKTPKSFSSRTYNPEKINLPYNSFIEVFKKLIELKWITEELGQKGKVVTKINPTEHLKEKFDKIGLAWAQQSIKSDEELILMRDVIKDGNNKKVKQTVHLPEYDDKKVHLENLKEINKALLNNCITLDLSDEDLAKVHLKDTDEHDDTRSFNKSLMITNIQLSRIFARGQVGLGGRFYRGWWQAIPSIHRPHIRINGYKTDEVDFSGIGIKILYRMVGNTYNKEDPYDIGLYNWQGKTDPRRKVVKKALNALVNDIDGNYKLSCKEIGALGLNNKEFKEYVFEAHKPIAHLFQTDAGLKAQFIDSRIAEAVMLKMIKQNSIALPIHDSFIVRLRDRGMLLNAMKESCLEIIGLEINTTSEYIKTKVQFGLTKEEVIDLNKDIKAGIISSTNTWKLLSKAPSIMDKYLSSFEAFNAGG